MGEASNPGPRTKRRRRVESSFWRKIWAQGNHTVAVQNAIQCSFYSPRIIVGSVHAGSVVPHIVPVLAAGQSSNRFAALARTASNSPSSHRSRTSSACFRSSDRSTNLPGHKDGRSTLPHFVAPTSQAPFASVLPGGRCAEKPEPVSPRTFSCGTWTWRCLTSWTQTPGSRGRWPDRVSWCTTGHRRHSCRLTEEMALHDKSRSGPGSSKADEREDLPQAHRRGWQSPLGGFGC